MIIQQEVVHTFGDNLTIIQLLVTSIFMTFTNLIGTWQNEFGSLLTIEQLDTNTGIFSGFYSSHTGATGVYYVTGITDVNPDPNVNSQTLSFSVSWRNISSDKEGQLPQPLVARQNQKSSDDDESMHWVSAFSGQLQVINNQLQITTTYLLQENSDPANNWGSTIVATATFTQVQ